MPTLRLDGFDGVVPRTSATALGDRQAQRADNVRLYNGELRPWRGPLREFTPASPDSMSIYKMVAANGDSLWLTWPADVDVAPGPSADLSDVRVYFTGAGSPRKTNWSLAHVGSGPFPGDYQEMGVPAPSAAPTLATTTGSNPAIETRVYVTTFVNTFGALKEESAPSPASASVTVAVSEAVVVSGLPAAPAGKYNITAVRIYRSISGTSGANYAFVAEVPIGTATYTDDLLSASLGEALSTLGWLPPPSNLQGITALAGGVLAGFAGNTVYFSEPYFPHAWPIRYALNVPATIVGLGAIGTSLAVLTDLSPYVISGVTPGAMGVEKIPLQEPCVSKRSIAVDALGVVYASPNGLVTVGQGNQGIATQNLFRRDEWQSHVPETMVGVIFEGHYYGFFRSPVQRQRCLVLSRDDTPALCYVEAAALAAHVDARTARLYYLQISDGAIYAADASSTQPYTYQWRSKRFVMPKALSYSLIRVDAEFVDVVSATLPTVTCDSDEITCDSVDVDCSQGYLGAWAGAVADVVSANQNYFGIGAANSLGAFGAAPVNRIAVNESLVQSPPSVTTIQDVSILIWGDRQVVAQAKVSSMDPVRLPPFKAREIEVSITGSIPLRSITLATSGAELRG